MPPNDIFIMGTSCVFSYVLLLFYQTLCVIACPPKYNRQPLYGHHCITTSSNVVVSLRQADRPQCVWKCLRLENCQYINHNYDTRQCDLGLSKCESLVPVVDGEVNTFGPPRDICVHWGSSQESGRVLVKTQKQLYLARIKRYGALVIGKFEIIRSVGRFWASNEGVRVGPVYVRDQDIEFLTMDPACTLPWISYSAGGLLPVGAMSGGHLTDGSTTYVAKVVHNGEELFGYYNTKSQLAYFEKGGAHTKTTMKLLVLI